MNNNFFCLLKFSQIIFYFFQARQTIIVEEVQISCRKHFMKSERIKEMLCMKTKFITLSILLVASSVKSQDLLTLEDVIKITIEKNFDIEIAKNNIQVAKNNNNIGLVGAGQSTGGTVSGGTTGMLPQVSIAAGSPQNPLGIGKTTSTLKYDPSSGIPDVNGRTLNTVNYSPSLVVTWYFFDGLKCLLRKRN